MNDLDKLRIMLPHWIEHQVEHARELQTWAKRLQQAGQKDGADRLLAAANMLQQAGDHLSSLLDAVTTGEAPENQATGDKS